jgi:hypothetical protein
MNKENVEANQMKANYVKKEFYDPQMFLIRVLWP